MTIATRVYLVTNGDTKKLVEASSQAQALRHVVRSQFTVTVPTTLDLVVLMQGGAKVEKAGADE